GYSLLRARSTAAYFQDGAWTYLHGESIRPIHVDSVTPTVSYGFPNINGMVAARHDYGQKYTISRYAKIAVTVDDWAPGRGIATIQMDLRPVNSENFDISMSVIATMVAVPHEPWSAYSAYSITRAFSLESFWAAHPLLSGAWATFTATDAAGHESLPVTVLLMLDASSTLTVPGASTLSFGQQITGTIGDSFGLGSAGTQVDVYMDGLYYGSAMTNVLGQFSMPFETLDVFSTNLVNPAYVVSQTDCNLAVNTVVLPNMRGATTYSSSTTIASRWFMPGQKLELFANIAGSVHGEDDRLKNGRLSGSAIYVDEGVSRYEGIVVDLILPDLYNYATGLATFDSIDIVFLMQNGKEYTRRLERDEIASYFSTTTSPGSVSTMIGGSKMRVVRIPVSFAMLQQSDIETAISTRQERLFDPAGIVAMRVAAVDAAVYPNIDPDAYELVQSLGIAGVYFADILFGVRTWQSVDTLGDPSMTHVISYKDHVTGAIAASTTSLSLDQVDVIMEHGTWEAPSIARAEYSDYIMVDGLSITTAGGRNLHEVMPSMFVMDSVSLVAGPVGASSIPVGTPVSVGSPSLYSYMQSIRLAQHMTFQLLQAPQTLTNLRMVYPGSPFFTPASELLAASFIIDKEGLIFSSDIGRMYSDDVAFPAGYIPQIKALLDGDVTTGGSYTAIAMKRSGAAATAEYTEGVIGSAMIFNGETYLQTDLADKVSSWTISAAIKMSAMEGGTVLGLPIIDARAVTGGELKQGTALGISTRGIEVLFNDGAAHFAYHFTGGRWYH
ncbi:MAG: hypothetical protein GYA24_20535, partial [Candidatus Lokiarchaeota archaeon]|nr:hypothetical protein [Candidatus Lokiarchaeota archaeon]